MERRIGPLPTLLERDALACAHRTHSSALLERLPHGSGRLPYRRTRLAAHTLGSRAGMPLQHGRPNAAWRAMAKTALDVAVAALAVVLLLPLLLAIAAAISLDSPGPVLFRQRRHGHNHCEFLVFKFRTMAWARDPASRDGQAQTQRGDRRITRVGNFLRRTSLDELPQLFNVLNGTMSLVGPRPHPVAMRTENRLCHEIVADYSRRHCVKPGITGWAQIHGHRGATETAEQLRRRVEHDLYYVEHRTVLMDLQILLLTPVRILFDRDNAF